MNRPVRPSRLPASWAASDVPISTGFLPRNAIVLDSMRHDVVVDGVVEAIRHSGCGRREAALTLVHHVVAAMSDAVVRPLAIDRLEVSIPANQIAVQINSDGAFEGVWISSWTVQPRDSTSVHRVGERLGAAIRPLLLAASDVGRVRHRNTLLTAGEAMLLACRRHAGGVGDGDLSWCTELLGAMRLPARDSVRTMTLHAAGEECIGTSDSLSA